MVLILNIILRHEKRREVNEDFRKERKCGGNLEEICDPLAGLQFGICEVRSQDREYFGILCLRVAIFNVSFSRCTLLLTLTTYCW